MDKQAFALALECAENSSKACGGIGTLQEKILHLTLKHYFEPLEISHEIKIGRYVADIVNENGIIEIQTRSFDKLRNKLSDFLDVANVTVVYPIPASKWIIWVDTQTGESSAKRKSPKKGNFYSAFYELYKIKNLLTSPLLNIHLLLIDMIEYKNLNGWSKNKKRGSSRNVIIPVELVDELVISSPADFLKLVPFPPPEQFSSRDFAKATGLSLKLAQTALNVLFSVGAVQRIGKNRNSYIYLSGKQ